MGKGEGRDEGENDNGAAAQRQKAGGEFCHRVRQRTQLEDHAAAWRCSVPVCVAEVLENAAMMAEAARRYVDERAS